ncbi:hypothetical protein REPUB_Repub06bG0128800 [Reevesia pubescens]
MEHAILSSEIAGVDLRGAITRNVPLVIVLLEVVVERCIIFIGGSKADELILALDDIMLQYISTLQDTFKSLKAVCGVDHKNMGLDKFSVFEASLRVSLARLSTSLSVSVFGPSLDQNQLHVTNDDGNREPSLGGMTAFDVAAVRLVNSKDPRFHALPLASQRVAAFAETVNELVYDVLISKVRQRLSDTCAAIDQELEQYRKIDSFHDGTTTLTIVRHGDLIYVANVGDSRVILATTSDDGNLVPIQLTVDFKPNLPQEAEQITQCKWWVFCLYDEPRVYRVWLPDEESSRLAMSRALGDYCLKDYGLIFVSEVTQRHITSRDQFVVLATDGVWDVISNQEVVQIVSSTPEKAKAAKYLVKCAVYAWKKR